MKSITKTILHLSILITSLALVGCMPDSLTKFKEDAPKKKEADGGIIIAPPPETCTPSTPTGGYCTPLSGVAYPTIVSNSIKIEIDQSTFGNPITTLTPNLFPAGNNAIDYTIFSISPALPAGLNFNQNTGTISGIPASAHARTQYTVTATHANYQSTPVQTQFYLSVGTAIGELDYNIPGFSASGNSPVRLIVGLGEATNSIGTPLQPKFVSTNSNTPNFSSSNGARGMVRYINYFANEVFLEAHNIASETSFKPDDRVDSASSYFAERGVIDGITIGFPSLRGMISQLAVAPSGNRIVLNPSVKPVASTSFFSNEQSLLRYSISPSFPTGSGLSLNTVTGNIEWTPSTNPALPAYDPKLDREYYTIYVMNTNSQVVSKTIRLSIQDIAAAKSIGDIYYPQVAGSNVILQVSDVGPFAPKSRLTGTLNITNGNAVITGQSTNFQSELTTGSKFVINNRVFTVQTVNSSTSVTVAPAPSETGNSLIAIPLNSTISGFSDGDTPTDIRDDIKVRGLVHTIDQDKKELYVKITHNIDQGSLAKPDLGFSSGMKLFNGSIYQYEVATVTDVITSIDVSGTHLATPLVPQVIKSLYIYPFHQAGGTVSLENLEQLNSLRFLTTPDVSAILGNLNLGQHGSIEATGQLIETDTNVINYNITNAFGRRHNKTLQFRLQEKPILSLSKSALLALKASEYSLNDVAATFQIGSTISAPISAPSTEVKRAKVKEIFSSGDEVFILVDILSGDFEAGDALDNWRMYATERARIQRTLPVSHKLVLNSAAPTTFLDNVVSFTTGANAKVSLIDGSNIFVVLVNDGEIRNGDTVTFTPLIGAPVTRTVSQIHTNQIKFTLDFEQPAIMTLVVDQDIPSSLPATITFSNGTSGTFLAADTLKKVIHISTSGNLAPNVTTTNVIPTQLTIRKVQYPFEAGNNIVKIQDGMGAGATGRGMINRVTSPSITGATEVGVTVDYGYFIQGWDVSNYNSERPGSLAGTIASAPRTENLFTLYRGQPTTIKINLEKGRNSLLTVYPALPNGLTIDQEKGVISGTPIDAKARTTYTITATNGLDSVDFKFLLRVNSVFEIMDQTESRSPVLTQSGRNNHTRACIITDDMIASGNTNIDCHLNVGELDLHFHGINYHSNTSAGICSYVKFTPFAFNRKEPKLTRMNYLKRTGDAVLCHGRPNSDGGALLNTSSSNVPGDTIYIAADAEPPKCYGDYDDIGINCDTGKYRLTTYTYTARYPDLPPPDPTATPTPAPTPVDCVVNSFSSEVECGGEKAQCIHGAIIDFYTSSSIEGNIRNSIVSAENGLNGNQNQDKAMFEVKPTNGTLATMKNSNFTYNNACQNQTDPWEYKSSSWLHLNQDGSNGYADPFKDENPYYTFSCLNNAFSTVAEIKISVREWDMDFTGRAPIFPATGTTLGSIFDITLIKPQNYMSERNDDDRYDWDSRGSRETYRNLSGGVEPANQPARYPAGFCDINQGYGAIANSTSVSTLVFAGNTNIVTIATPPAGLIAGDLLAVQLQDSGGTNLPYFSYFTIQQDLGSGRYIVSRPYGGDLFSEGQDVTLHRIEQGRRLRFPLDTGALRVD